MFDRSGEVVGDCNNKIRALKLWCNGSDHDQVATHMLKAYEDGIVYKTPNIQTRNYIISDVLHLVKTTEHAWANFKKEVKNLTITITELA